MGLSPHSIKRFAGLFASTNPYGRIPEGAQSVADNCSLRSSDVLEPRRGFKASASCGAPVNALAFKQGVAVGITYDNPGSGITGTLRKYDPVADAWTTLPMNPGALTIDCPGSFAGVDTRFVSAQKALYFQSKYGLAKIEDIASGVCRCALSSRVPIGASQTTAPDGSTGSIGSSGTLWLASGSTVAYRITIARFGANGELIESAPSDRLIFRNNLVGAAQPRINVLTPALSQPGCFVRVYRAASSPTGTPSDEMFLVKEVPITQAAGSNGFVADVVLSFPEISADKSLSVPLYTNAQTGGTLAVANDQAPLASDIAWFRSRMYSLNNTQRQSLTVRVIGTGTGGIVDGDSILIGGKSIRFTTNFVGASLDGTLSYADTSGATTANIDNTARALAATISFDFDPDPNCISGASIPGPAIGGPLYSQLIAFCPTSADADAGTIVIQALLPGTPPFTFQASSSLGWDRDYTAGTSSTPTAQAASLAWSNVNQPEGFPLANGTIIGDPTAAGQRCIALKEALFIFKQDGLWKLTDDGSSLGPLIQPVDPTIRLVAPETAVALDNFILALCDQGVILISETGAVVNISHRQIERELFALMARVGSSTLANLAFGVAYPAEHTYILSLPESSNAGACTRQYVYNLETQAWSSWTVPGVLCGAVHPDTGQLYLGRTDGTIWIERKNYDSTDYQDPGFTIASPVTTITPTMIFAGDLRTGATPIAVGDVIQQFQATNTLQQRVIAVAYNSSLNQTTVTLDNSPRTAWNNAVLLTVVKAIQVKPTFLPLHADEPLQDKEWGDAYLSFRYCDLDFTTVGWTSEKYQMPTGTNPAIERINNADGSVAPIPLQGWGVSSWGGSVWGRQTKDVVLKCTLPEEVGGYSAQLTLGLTLPCGLARFELSAIDVKISGDTTQTTR